MSTPDSTPEIEKPTKALKVQPISWVALGLSVLGFIFAIIPDASFFAWMIITAAFIVSIVAVVKKGKRAVAVISLILSIVSSIVAIIVSIVTVFALAGAAATGVSE